MDLFAIIIVIAVAIIKSALQKSQNEKPRRQKQSDYVGQMKKGMDSLEKTLNQVSKKSIKTYSERDERNKAIEEANRLQKERQEHQKREWEKQHKRELEEKRKKEELKKKQAEKERKAKEEKEMLEKFHVSEQSKRDCKECNEVSPTQEAKEQFCLEHYLDPLTAPFYPGNVKQEKSDTFHVDDYLFPALAPYYPKVEDKVN